MKWSEVSLEHLMVSRFFLYMASAFPCQYSITWLERVFALFNVSYFPLLDSLDCFLDSITWFTNPVNCVWVPGFLNMVLGFPYQFSVT